MAAGRMTSQRNRFDFFRSIMLLPPPPPPPAPRPPFHSIIRFSSFGTIQRNAVKFGGHAWKVQCHPLNW